MRIIKFISEIYRRIIKFYKEKLPEVTLLLVLFPIFIAIRQLPYINIIKRYEEYVIGIYLILILLLFRQQITPKKISFMVGGFIFLSILASLFAQDNLANLAGFIIFSLVLAVVLIEFFSQRKSLRDIN